MIELAESSALDIKCRALGCQDARRVTLHTSCHCWHILVIGVGMNADKKTAGQSPSQSRRKYCVISNVLLLRGFC